MESDLEQAIQSGMYTRDEVLSLLVERLSAETLSDALTFASKRGWSEAFGRWLHDIARGNQTLRGGVVMSPPDAATTTAKAWFDNTPRASTLVDLRDEEERVIPAGSTVAVIAPTAEGWWQCATESGEGWVRARPQDLDSLDTATNLSVQDLLAEPAAGSPRLWVDTDIALHDVAPPRRAA